LHPYENLSSYHSKVKRAAKSRRDVMPRRTGAYLYDGINVPYWPYSIEKD